VEGVTTPKGGEEEKRDTRPDSRPERRDPSPGGKAKGDRKGSPFRGGKGKGKGDGKGKGRDASKGGKSRGDSPRPPTPRDPQRPPPPPSTGATQRPPPRRPENGVNSYGDKGCFNCGSFDHWRDACPLPKKEGGYPPELDVARPRREGTGVRMTPCRVLVHRPFLQWR
jgi:hypothetical protein